MKEEITSTEFWALPDDFKKYYQRISLVFDGRDWVEREIYSEKPVRIKSVYRYKPYKESTFGGLGMGTV